MPAGSRHTGAATANHRAFSQSMPHLPQSVGIDFAAPQPAPRVRINATHTAPQEPIMIDRIFLPALVFVMLVGALAAFVADVRPSAAAPQQVVRLQRVVVTAQREQAATPVARAETAQAAVVR
jgi:hypothetical protein